MKWNIYWSFKITASKETKLVSAPVTFTKPALGNPIEGQLKEILLELSKRPAPDIHFPGYNPEKIMKDAGIGSLSFKVIGVSIKLDE